MSTGNFNFPSTAGGGGGGGVAAGDTITPYVVSTDGTYNTVQAAVDAAEAAGGGLVWIRPGSYTEDVTISSDDMYLMGPEPGAVVITGEMTINAGVNPGDASNTHKVGLKNLTLLAGAGDTTVLSVSGNPQELFLDGVVVDCGAGATDGVVFSVSGGVVHLRDTKCVAQSGATGVPFELGNGSGKFYSGCEVGLEDAASDALVITQGAIDVYDQIIVNGTISNLSIGNGTYAALIQEAYITTNNTQAFDAQGSGAFGVYRAVVTDNSGSNPDLGSGAGTFFWSGLETHINGYSNSNFPSCNTAAGPLQLNGIEYGNIRQVSTNGDAGYVLTADGLGSYDWGAIPDPTASTVTYTPADAGDWDPDPTTSAEALDDLGARVTVLEGAYPAEVSLGTQSTGDIAASGGTSNINFALPSGITNSIITRITVTRTAGTGTSCTIEAYNDDARAGDPIYLVGGAFNGYTVNPGPVEGPWIEISAGFFKLTVPYYNSDASEFVRLTVTNQDFTNNATYNVTLYVLPLE